MNKDYSKIDMVLVNDVLNQWNLAVTNFGNDRVFAAKENFFSTLSSVGLDSGFAASYDKNNEALTQALSNTSKSILATLANIEELDENVRNDILELLGEKPRDEDGGGGDGPGDGGGGTRTPTQEELIDNSKEQLEQYKNLSLSDLNAVTAELVKLAKSNNTTLDEILNNDEYALKVHSMMLLCPNISEDFKVMIENGRTDISQKLLQNILYGGSPEIIGLDENTSITVKKYLEMVAQNNNISVQQLLTDENYSSLLKDSLGSFGNVAEYVNTLDESSITDELLAVYDGNQTEKVTASEVSILRSFIDQLATSNNTDSETLLTSGTSNIQQSMNGLGRTSLFVNTVSNFASGEMGSVLSSLFKISNNG